MTNVLINAVIVSVILQTNWVTVPDISDKEVGIITEKRTYLVDRELIEGKSQVLPLVPLLRDPGPKISEGVKYGYYWWTNVPNYSTLEMTNIYNTNQFKSNNCNNGVISIKDNFQYEPIRHLHSNNYIIEQFFKVK